MKDEVGKMKDEVLLYDLNHRSYFLLRYFSEYVLLFVH